MVILGSTGSIGTQSLEVAEHLGIAVEGICFKSNVKLGTEQLRRYKPKYCAVHDKGILNDITPYITDVIFFTGEDGIRELISSCESETVINAVSGQDGLGYTLAAIRAGKNIALANKESLVAAGDIIMAEAVANGVSVLPVDSEHSAIMQCMGNEKDKVNRIIITASGGPFFGMNPDELQNVTVSGALTHPTWSMGAKITIDSATLMNKGLELIEAYHLFGIQIDNIDIIIHRESIIHSMVEFKDYSVLSQMGNPDMRMCIQYALEYPERTQSLCRPLNLRDIKKLTFYEVDNAVFPMIDYARHAVKRGGVIAAAMNAANDAAVNLFLNERIKFTEIFNIVEKYTVSYNNIHNPSVETITDVINEVSKEVYELYGSEGNI